MFSKAAFLSQTPLLAVVLSFSLTESALAVGGSPPNIVLILSDDHHWRDYSYTGENPYVATPNIDRLAAEGVLYQRAYAPTSICRPSLTNIFTGLNSVTSLVVGNKPEPLGSGFPDSANNHVIRRAVEVHATLPRILGRYGYRSLQTGKWWEGAFQRAGFDEGMTGDGDRAHAGPRATTIGRNGLAPIEDFVEQAVRDEVPFFISYAPVLPHTPHNPPSAFRARYDAWVDDGEITANEADYYAMIDWFDSTVGELRTFLEQTPGSDGTPLDNDTLYVYAVDNGWRPVLHGTQQTAGADRGKITPYEGGVRGPIIFSWRDWVFDERSLARKLRDSRLASTVDILSTLLSLIGAESDVPNLAQGIDLLTQSRNEVFGDSYDDSIPFMDGALLVFDQPERPRTSRWMIRGRWKLIVPDGEHFTGQVQLYDVIEDPDETTNRAATEATRVAEMSARIDEWWAASRSTYLYDHEFDGGIGSIDGFAPDIDRTGAAAVWHSTGGIRGEGTFRGGPWNPGHTAQLAFIPQAGRRYELRASIAPLSSGWNWTGFGFLDAGTPDQSPADDALIWVMVRDDVSNTTGDVTFHANDDGSGVGAALVRLDLDDSEGRAVTVVLDTHDHDEGLRGDQWRAGLLVDGLSEFAHVYRLGNPEIANVAIGSWGTQFALGQIDYFQLVETPGFESLALAPGDANGDGVVDRADLRSVVRNLSRPRNGIESPIKTWDEGDFDGDGDVDWHDLFTIVRSITRSRTHDTLELTRFSRRSRRNSSFSSLVTPSWRTH